MQKKNLKLIIVTLIFLIILLIALISLLIILEKKNEKINNNDSNIVNNLVVENVLNENGVKENYSNIVENDKEIVSENVYKENYSNVEENNNEVKNENEYIYEVDSYKINKEYGYSTDENISYTDILSCPHINIDSEDARNVNLELVKKFEEAKNSLTYDDKETRTFHYRTMKYDYYITENNILSLVVYNYLVYVPGGAGYDKYTYNFDINTGKLLSTKEVLEKLGVNDINKTMEEYYINLYNTKLDEKSKDPNLAHPILEEYDTAEEYVQDHIFDIEKDRIYIIDENRIMLEMMAYDFEISGRFKVFEEIKIY